MLIKLLFLEKILTLKKRKTNFSMLIFLFIINFAL
jgi:hypothetical protein